MHNYLEKVHESIFQYLFKNLIKSTEVYDDKTISEIQNSSQNALINIV